VTGLEDDLVAANDDASARVSLVLNAGELPGVAASVWMGGARSLQGELLGAERLARGMVVDCAGELPATAREAAALWHACVFVDHDGPLAGMHRLEDVAQAVATTMRNAESEEIDAVYVMCTHGMNRSGLLTGLILRELGMSGAEAVARIRQARAGALSNQWFRALLERG
jgi:hypothetical protein